MLMRFVALWLLLNWLVGRLRAVYHAGRVPNRRDAIVPCGGVAFWTRGPLAAGEMPTECWTCGQSLRPSQLDWREVVAREASAPVAVDGDVRQLNHGPRPRRPRHYGQIVTEQETSNDGSTR